MSEALLQCAEALSVTTRKVEESSSRIITWSADHGRIPSPMARADSILVLTALQEINEAFQSLVTAMNLLSQEYMKTLATIEQDT